MKGKQFEIDLIKALKQVKNLEVVLPTKRQDELEGTDIFVDRIRVDATLNWKRKVSDHTRAIGHVVLKGEFKNYDIRFGFRTGNEHRCFKEPVLVIALDLDTPDEYDWNWFTLKSLIAKNAEALIEEGMDCFWEYQDSLM